MNYFYYFPVSLHRFILQSICEKSQFIRPQYVEIVRSQMNNHILVEMESWSNQNREQETVHYFWLTNGIFCFGPKVLRIEKEMELPPLCLQFLFSVRIKCSWEADLTKSTSVVGGSAYLDEPSAYSFSWCSQLQSKPKSKHGEMPAVQWRSTKTSDKKKYFQGRMHLNW